MLILSKDRKYLYNIDTIKGLFVRNATKTTVIYADTNGAEDGMMRMGEYPTEKAALEELEKIATENGWKSLYEMGQE